MKTQQKNYEIDMLHGPLAGKILLFALPLMLSTVLQLLFNAADVVVVGRFAGKQALAAVGSKIGRAPIVSFNSSKSTRASHIQEFSPS